ncbi:MAG: YfhO family protein [Deltaproteobacteria bacterium]|nr:YfhO family protein [Deltaproteobacteria bacterium]
MSPLVSVLLAALRPGRMDGEAPGAAAAAPWRSALLVLALGAAPFVYFWRATAGEVVLAPGDAQIYSFPSRLLAVRMALDGHLPLWNPYVFGGFPLLAEMQNALLYPGTWLLALFSPSVAVNLFTQATYSVAILGTYAYARQVGSSRFGAAFGGLTFGFCGWMIAHMGHTCTIHGMAWLPWFLFCLDRLRQRTALRYVAGAAAAVALVILAGHPPIPMYVLITGGLHALFFAWRLPPAGGRWRYLLLCGASVLLALGLCGLQLVPTVELMQQSVRATLSYEAFVSFSLPLGQLPMLLFPYLFGGGPTVPYWGAWWGLWELIGYAGVVPLMLALASLRLARSSPAACFWCLMGGLGVLLALGDSTPVGRLLYHVPVYNLFRAPARNIYLFDFAVALLSALALTHLVPHARRALSAGAVAVAVASLAVAALAVFAGRLVWGPLAKQAFPGGFDHPALQGAMRFDNPAIALPVLISALAAGTLLLLARRPSTGRKAALLAVHLADLSLLGAWMPNFYPPTAGAWQAPNYIQRLRELEPDPSAFRIVVATAGGYGPVGAGYALASVPMVNGYDPFMISRYGELAGGMNYSGTIADATLASRSPFLDLLNARYLLAIFPDAAGSARRIGHIDFAAQGFDAHLAPGDAVRLALPRPVRTAELGVVSFLSQATDLADGTPVARVTLDGADGRRVELLLRAGSHTAEWAFDRPDVAPLVRHRRAPIAETADGVGGRGNSYSAVLDGFAPLEVTHVSVERLGAAATLHLVRLSLYDAASDRSTPLTPLHQLLADAPRWTPRFGNGVVEVLENRDVLPRAWLVPTTTALPADDVTRTVRDGRFPDGRRFDPRLTALVEDRPAEHFGELDPDAFARITTYQPNAVELVTGARQAAMLVLSETFYPGWRATLDGAAVPIVRVNGVLRGVALPAGEHRVRFDYRPRALAIGAAVSGTTLLALAGLCVWRLRGGGGGGGGSLRRPPPGASRRRAV